MELINFFTNHVAEIAAGIGGILLTLITERILNKRGLFTYSVSHTLAGVSADETTFGSLRVTWNGNVVPNLYSSVVDLVNNSQDDYEDVVVRAYTADTTNLLTEKTEIVDTTHGVQWTEAYQEKLAVEPGSKPSTIQQDTYWHQREYLVPTMNRGQTVRLSFLCSAEKGSHPLIWLDVLHKGVKLRFSSAQNKILGVAQSRAAIMGMLLGLVVLWVVISFIDTVWIASLCTLVYGFGAQIPGAWVIRSTRALRDSLGG